MSNFRGQVQGFAVGAAVVSALMLTLPALFAPTSPHEDMDVLAAQFDVEIVWSSISTCTAYGEGADGCWIDTMPSRIFVSPDLKPESLRYIVLHEIGHVIHWRLNLPGDECAADRFAQALGADRGSYCPPKPD